MTKRKLILIGGGHLLVQEILDRMSQSHLPIQKIQLLSDGERVGEIHEFRNQPILVSNACDMIEEGYDAAVLLSALKDLEKLTRDLVLAGVPLIDMCNHFKASADVPVMMPDSEQLESQNLPMISIIPILESQVLITVLKALNNVLGKTGIWRQAVVFTLQGVSCEGSRQAMDELFDQTRHIIGFTEVEAVRFPRQIAFNAFHTLSGERNFQIIESHAGNLGHSMIVSADYAWCAFFVGLLGTLWLEADTPVSLNRIVDRLSKAPDIELRESIGGALAIVGQDKLIVSDIRIVPGNPRCLTLRFGMDNLQKGSASTLTRLLESVWMEDQT
ncbi:hypothetical protein JW823_06990 [bacterium]|nr:hypothetical protein [candidate division CSSED10-310 bacterium]